MRKNFIIGILLAIGFAIIFGAWYLQSLHPPPPTSLKEVSLCPSLSLSSTLIWVAQDQGYFAKHGLNVTFKQYPTASMAMQDILNGKLDFLLASEYAVSEQLLNKKPLRFIGTIAESDVMSVIGRRDRRIVQVPDLEGKKIGITRNTMAEYLLGRFFVLNGLSLRNTTVIYLQPAELVDAIVEGDIDAALVWEPYVYQMQQRMGGNAVVWPANLGQHAIYSIVCTETRLQEDPGIIEGLLASLLEAETFVHSHPEDAKKIAQNQIKYDDQYMNNEWQKHHFSVGLSQALVTSMEDETRWKIRNNMTAGIEVPDFSNDISSDALYRLKPSAVTIIG
jgi:ABC-type nitrate/sulfonate/bicarbonate transport system substrate-binding protein